ncbi:MAG: UDP-N-acetylmuramoyl-L-alanyl-D-glutamate--2,6-diaminopimelate ligase [Rhodocyclales bacterium]|nr:UDP-N-acetylmuramoyl-L-alanyl-D-glutamate--2,6-diaminopimelate ligase [Rhodocyclales bacterium]
MRDRAVAILDQLAQLGVRATSLCADSRAVAPGDVFVAYPGARADGRRFIADAVARRAAAVLWESRGQRWDAALAVPNLAVPDLQALSGPLAHLVYGRPSEKLWTVGVTGTNGKTSVSQWIARTFAELGRPCAVIGTLGSGLLARSGAGDASAGLAASLNTTPDALTLHRLLAGFLARGAQAAAMEVSSIGLDQGRANGVHFDVAVFTNLTRDHLEYHGSMAAYGAAKERLFLTPGLKSVVLNLDDALGRKICRDLAGSGVTRLGYTLRAGTIEPGAADLLLVAEEIAATPRGLRFAAGTPQGRAEIHAPLVGEFNAANLLAVLGTLLASAVPLEAAAGALARLTPPPGRMQTLGGDGMPLAVVDYAHTPDALEKALGVLREMARVRGGRLVCVFGCGGGRDSGKRPLMGEAATRLADAVLLTSDNPRDEDPQAILADIARGAPGAKIIADRAAAIAAAIAAADARDVLLIAGKGHEPYQEIAGRRLSFSDVECAAVALAAWGGQAR